MEARGGNPRAFFVEGASGSGGSPSLAPSGLCVRAGGTSVRADCRGSAGAGTNRGDGEVPRVAAAVWRPRIQRRRPTADAMSPSELVERKQALRTEAFERRKAQEDKDELTRQIVATFLRCRSTRGAKTVMFYVDVRSEVRTRHDLPATR